MPRSDYPELILQLAAINKGAFGLRANGDAPYHCGAVTVAGERRLRNSCRWTGLIEGHVL